MSNPKPCAPTKRSERATYFVVLVIAVCASLASSLTPAAEPQQVLTRPLAQLLVRGELRANAQVIPAQRSALSAETTATVAATPVEVGQRVEKGEVLMRLDRRDAELRLAAAKAAVAAAQAGVDLSQVRLERAGQLAEKNFVSADEYKERQAISAQDSATLALRQSELDLAKRDLQRCTITAPYSGWVTARHAQLGQLAIPGTVLLELVADGGAEISATLDPAAAAQLESDSKVQFVDELNRQLPLRWLRSSAVIDPLTRQIEVRFAFADRTAPPGSSGRIVWDSSGGRLPAEYLVRRDGQLGVLWADGAVARFHPLPSADAGRPASVDLPADTALITDGRQHLNDGDPIARNP